MAVNKMTFVGVGGIDLTGDTAVETDVAEGKIFHKADGTQGIGTAQIGGDTLAGLYINKTLRRYENLEATNLFTSAFRDSQIQYVNMPNLNNIYNYAFAGSTLKEISLPQLVQTVNAAYAFSRCASLKDVSLPNCKEIAQHMFDNSTAIETFTAPKIERVDDSGFLGAFKGIYESGVYTGIIELTLNSLTYLDNYAFYGAKIKKLTCPSLTRIGNMCFYDSTIEEFTIPATCTTIGSNQFVNTKKLTKLIIEADLTSIPTAFINGAISLQEVDLTHCSQVPTLSKSSYFVTPSTCVIKVPAALETEWKQATNWVAYASQIVGV